MQFRPRLYALKNYCVVAPTRAFAMWKLYSNLIISLLEEYDSKDTLIDKTVEF